MEIHGSGSRMGLYPQYHTGSVHQALTQFGGGSTISSEVPAASIKKEGPGCIRQTFNFITSIPSIVFNAFYTAFKYTVYMLTCGTICKLDHDPAKLKKALEKVHESEDLASAWADFENNFPRGVDQLNNLAIISFRDAACSENPDPKVLKEWEETQKPLVLKKLNEGWETQNLEQLEAAIAHLDRLLAKRTEG